MMVDQRSDDEALFVVLYSLLYSTSGEVLGSF